MAKQEVSTAASVVRTSAGLRDAIFDELDALRNGTSNPTKANAVAKLATTVVETVRMEIEVAKHAVALRTARKPDEAPAPDKGLIGGVPLSQPLALGA